MEIFVRSTLPLLFICVAFVCISYSEVFGLDLGPGILPSNKTLGGGPRSVLVFETCRFPTNGTLRQISFSVATADWLMVQIWRPVEIEAGQGAIMQLVYETLVKCETVTDLKKVDLTEDDVQVLVGDRVGLMKLNETFPIPYTFHPQSSTDLWFHSLGDDDEGWEDDPPTLNDLLTFEELGFPYRFSVLVTFDPEVDDTNPNNVDDNRGNDDGYPQSDFDMNRANDEDNVVWNTSFNSSEALDYIRNDTHVQHEEISSVDSNNTRLINIPMQTHPKGSDSVLRGNADSNELKKPQEILIPEVSKTRTSVLAKPPTEYIASTKYDDVTTQVITENLLDSPSSSSDDVTGSSAFPNDGEKRHRPT